MIKVYQTKFGGLDNSIEEQGNCFQACLASVLEIPLEQCFDVRRYGDGIWFDELNKWLADYELACVWVYLPENKEVTFTLPLGYHLAEVKSTTLSKGENHVVVIKDYKLEHDPNPHAINIGDLVGIYLFVPLDAAKAKKSLAIVYEGGASDAQM